MFRKIYRVLVALAIVAATTGLLVSNADARIGGGASLGSRGSRTFSAPPPTSTMPSAAPVERSMTQPNFGNPRPGFSPSPGGFFGFGRSGFWGGLAAGFLGAGLFGLLFGHGFFGGVFGLVSFLGLIFQLALIAFLAMFLWRWFQRRSEPAYAGPLYRDNLSTSFLGGLGLGGAQSAGSAGARQRSDDVGITSADYDAFERLLGDIQTAYGNEDLNALRARATPEMVSYFSEDLAQNASRGVVNRISDVKLLQGDLAEAWREGSTEYATVAMRFALNDIMVDRASGRVVEGGPQEVAEAWTFRRTSGGPWMLTAIQQAR
ncbi:MAG TPA: TIM44-like domain-containing protein [Xanthobacteraceae bacterium]|jgi:predicted lipid-binding transport protein (Tim44 family)|nr:TIM44-like domain-containing protein [Xanthobacteraceae bacterium]